VIRPRQPEECPPWCAGGHRCTARYGYRDGEHRSNPVTVRTPYGVMVCTRVQNVVGRARLELRLQVDLSNREARAEAQAVRVATEVDAAVRRALGQSTSATA
jgi:hypothetical protein